jgi:hypothetical protein
MSPCKTLEHYDVMFAVFGGSIARHKVIHNVNMPCLSLQLAAPAKSCRPHNKQLHCLNINVSNIFSVCRSTRSAPFGMDIRGLPSTVKLAIHLHLLPKCLERYLHPPPPLVFLYLIQQRDNCTLTSVMILSLVPVAWYDMMISE